MSHSTIRISCPKCIEPIRVPVDFAGRKGRCVNCKSPVRIPHPRVSPKAPHTRPPAPPTTSTPSRTAAPRVSETASAPTPINTAPTSRLMLVERHLRDYAPLRGSDRPQPLSMSQFSELKQATKLRSPIKQAATLYRIFFLFGAVGLGFSLVLTTMTGVSGIEQPGVIGLLGIAMLIQTGFVILNFFCQQATDRCHIWAPMVYVILSVLGIIGALLQIAMAGIIPGLDQQTALIGCSVLIGLHLIVGVISYRALASIPRFLRSPRWCCEALLYSGN